MERRVFLKLLQDEKLNDHYSVARGVTAVVDLTNEIKDQSTAKRKAQAQIDADDKTKKPKHGPALSAIAEQRYWDSPEAKKLFLGNSNDSRDVVEVLEERIERLQQANRSVNGWKDLVDKHDKDNLCSPYDVFIIRQRCSILCLAYTVALEEMNSMKWQSGCCEKALWVGSLMGIEAAATTAKAVAGWNILLRANREHFPQPNPRLHKDKRPLPELLEYFQEEISHPWQQYCIENLADLSVEMARDELVSRIIPRVFAATKEKQNDVRHMSVNDEDEDEDEQEDNDNNNGGENEQGKDNGNDHDNNKKKRLLKQDCLLNAYIGSPISLSTTWRWLRRLGFSYDARKKTFFVDGHEREDVVFRRNEFCKEYLTKIERRCHRWIQVTKETVERWRREKKPSEFNDNAKGYSYRSADGIEMVEFHVDDHDFLHDLAEEMGYGLMGGNLSVRMPPGSKPLMVFGQDECVFNQYLISSRQWVGPDGQRALLPKSDGLSLMMSAFQSRETGFGMNLSRIQLDEINESRRGKNYVDVDAAMAIHGQAMKKDLKSSPFTIYFELGANNEGYWTFNHMAIQFEDCVDCLRKKN